MISSDHCRKLRLTLNVNLSAFTLPATDLETINVAIVCIIRWWGAQVRWHQGDHSHNNRLPFLILASAFAPLAGGTPLPWTVHFQFDAQLLYKVHTFATDFQCLISSVDSFRTQCTAQVSGYFLSWQSFFINVEALKVYISPTHSSSRFYFHWIILLLLLYLSMML